MTFSTPPKETLWTAEDYSFNCTDKAVVNTDVHGSTCTLYFDQGKGSMKDVKFSTVVDARTYIYTFASGSTIAGGELPAAAFVKGSITAPATGSECEDHSGSVSASMTAAIALIGASFF